MAPYFITHEDVKPEINMASTETSKDTVLDNLCEAIEALWDELTDRTWRQQVFTEYYDADKYAKAVLLKNRPVAASPAVQLWDDPDWEWNAADLVAAADYRVDYEKGIIHYAYCFFEGRQSIKVVYTAGYTTATLPKAIQQILIRQVAHWYLQTQNRSLGKSSESKPGGGSTSFKDLKDNMLPDFVLFAELNSR